MAFPLHVADLDTGYASHKISFLWWLNIGYGEETQGKSPPTNFSIVFTNKFNK